MIPTAITRYKVEQGSSPFAIRIAYNKSINVYNGEAVTVYGFGHLVIRWSPLSVVIRRLFRR